VVAASLREAACALRCAPRFARYYRQARPALCAAGDVATASLREAACVSHGLLNRIVV
jgi:hypothetical protein